MYKIFVDAHVFDGEFQGTLTYIKEIYLKILEKNQNITIYFGANKIENVKKVFDKFENAKYVEYKSKNSFSRIFVEIPRIINKIKCTHAHFQYIIPFNKNKNCKHIVTIHDILFNDFPEEFSLTYRLKRNFLFYMSAKRADALLTVSNYSKRKISEQYHVSIDDIIVTPNAVSEEFYNFEYSKDDSRDVIKNNFGIGNYILYVSRVEPRKNQLLLLKTYLELALWNENLSLVFIGKNSLDSGLSEYIETLSDDIKHHILWLEQVEFIDLKHFLNAAKLFVYPSKAEGFGIPPLEAAALETPVLCSNTTAMEDFDFFEPFVFDPNDAHQFKIELKKIIEKLSNIDTKNIKTKVLLQYSWQKSANKLVEIINEFKR